ncbi:MAG: hypothetical protein V3U82_07790 [Robiginitomaculum sp.]
MKTLSKSTPVVPSLARAFESERDALTALLLSGDMSAPMVVSLARKALDRTGTIFAAQTQDVQVHKAGLWLLEMVKSGAGVLDSGAKAEIIWREVPSVPKRQIAGSTLFYGAAAGFAFLGWLEQSRLAMASAAVLAGLRFFDPRDWKSFIANKIPFIGRNKTPLIEDANGRKALADARLTVNGAGFVDGLADSLRTADHILLRLSEPMPEAFWHDDARLMSFVQGLLEAKTAGDGDFALRLIDTELATVLRSAGIETVAYSKKQARLFDALPGIGMGTKGDSMAAPALIKGEQILRRGTLWTDGE